METLNQINPKTKETIGSIERDKAHLDGICHMVIHVWIVTADRELLLQKRSPNMLYGDLWHISVAGHVHYKEAPLYAAGREVGEELSLSINRSDLKPIGNILEQVTIPETGNIDYEYRYLYVLIVDSKDVVGDLQAEEVSGTKWIGIETFKDGIQDETLYSQMLQHRKEYYLDTLKSVEKHID